MSSACVVGGAISCVRDGRVGWNEPKEDVRNGSVVAVRVDCGMDAR